MPRNDKGRRRTTGPAPATNLQSLDSFGTTDTATPAFRQGDPAAWIARRFGLPPATAAAVAHLAGIGGVHA